MADTLEVVILGTDKASPVFEQVGNNLGKAFKVGAGIAIGGLTALTTALGLSVKEAIDAEEIQAELNAVLKSTGGIAGMTANEINHLAGELSRVTKFSDDQIVSAETLLLTFTKIGDDIFPQATEAALNMAEIFGSADQAALQLGKALNDPIAGVGALRRVGVSFTKQQEDMIKTLVESGDILGAQQIILRELETEFGGVARAAGNTLGGKLVILKNRLLDVAEGIGMKLIPPLTDIANVILDKALPAIERFAEKITPVFESAIWPIQRLFDNLAKGMSLKDAFIKFFDDAALALEWFLTKIGVSTEFADKLTDAFRKAGQIIGDFIFDKIVPFVKEHAEGFKAALIAIGAVIAGATIIGGLLAIGGAIAALFNPITLIIGAIGLLAMAWAEDWGGIRSYIANEVWPVIKPILQDLKTWFEINLPKAILFLREIWETYLVPTLILLEAVWEEKIKPALINVADWFMTHLPVAIDVIKNYWETVLLPALNKLWEFWDAFLLPLFLDLAGYLDTAIPTAIDVLTGKFVRDLIPKFGDVKEAVRDLFGWLEDAKEALDKLLGTSPNNGGQWLTQLKQHAVGAGAATNQMNLSPAQFATYTGRLNYNADYQGPRSILRDSGGSGIAGHPYRIGIPELFIPDRSGTFAPLSDGDMIANTISSLQDAVSELTDMLRRAGMGGGSQQSAPNYNLTIHTNSSDERIRSDYESMRVWAGA